MTADVDKIIEALDYFDNDDIEDCCCHRCESIRAIRRLKNALTHADGEYLVVPREPPTKKLVLAFNDWCGHNKWIEATSLDEFYRRVVAVAATHVPPIAEKP